MDITLAETIAPTKIQHRLLEFLHSRREDRGLMADLRCALVDGKRHRAWPYLGQFGGIGDGYKAQAIQTIAGLYASHSEESSEGDLGTLCRQLLGDEERKQLATAQGVGPISRRFQHLLAAQGREVFDRAVRLILRAKAEDKKVNYSGLYEDFLKWEYQSDRVKTEWARSFWSPFADNGDEL